MLRFTANHLLNLDEKARTPADRMPDEVHHAISSVGMLRSSGPRASATVECRMTTETSVCRWRDVEGPFARNDMRRALRLAIRALDGQRRHHSDGMVGTDLVVELLDHLDAVAEIYIDTAEFYGTAVRWFEIARSSPQCSLRMAAGFGDRSAVAS